MNKKILYIIIGVIIIGGGSLGTYYYFNPLGGNNENLASGTILSDGELVALDSSHWGSGTVQIVQVSASRIELQFVNVEIANGPDLFVYLSDKSSFTSTGSDIGTYADLGDLTYNTGNFSYAIPSSIQLADYNSILIYCKQFSVVFSYATLTAV